MPMLFDLPARHGSPTKLTDLTPAERFVVRAFRRWVAAMGGPEMSAHGAVAWNDFARGFGTADGKVALSAFVAMVHGIARAARRPIRCHRPCCLGLSADELWIVRLTSAGQAADHALASILSCWLVAPAGQDDVVRNAIVFGGLLSRHGYDLPSRRRTGNDAGPTPRPVLADFVEPPAKFNAKGAKQYH